MPRTSGSRTSATDDARPEGAHRPPNRRSRAANAASASRRSSRAEVGPERVGEDELGVGRLPEHEVRDPELAGGADQQVDLGQLGRVEARRDRRLVDLVGREAVLDAAARRLDELRPAAVVEGDPEVRACRGPCGRALELLHPLAQIAGDPVAPAEEARAHALLARGRAAPARSSRRGSPSARPPRRAGATSSRSRRRRRRAS